MKQFTTCANVANRFFKVLQGYTKGIRFVAVLTVLLTMGFGQAWGETWEKVTSAPSDWSGDYLIVYEDGKVAFDGSRTTLDAASNTFSVTISDGKITTASTTGDTKYFTIAKSGSNYTIKSASGKYIGNNSNSNALTSSTTILNNTISLNNGEINIVSSGGAYLRYNATSSISNGSQTGLRFRYYKSSSYTGQKAIQLYKKKSAAYTFHYGEKDKSYQKIDFKQVVGTTNEWQITDFVFPDVNTNQACYVGYNGYWYNSNLGASNSKSADLYFWNMPLAKLQNDNACSNVNYLGWDRNSQNGHKVIGTLRIYDNDYRDNLAIAFVPNGYGLCYGKDGEAWSNIAFNGNDDVVTTNVITLTKEMIDGTYKYYVGLLTSDGGYSYCGNSSTLVMNTIGSYYNISWHDNLGQYSSGQAGVFRIWTNSCNGNNTPNFVCHFVPYYRVSYDLNGGNGTALPSQWYSCESGTQTITLPTKPTRDGYRFKGWGTLSVDATTYSFNPTSNVTLKAQWEKVYTVSFDLQGHGTAIDQQTVVAGGKATRPADPSATGYTFGGWYKESACTNVFDFNTAINANTTIYAKWTAKKYTYTLYPNTPAGATVIFKDKAGSSVDKIQITQTYGEAAQSFANFYSEISCEGYRFEGWYSATSGGSKWTQTQSNPADNGVFNFYARWTKVHTITWKVNSTTHSTTTVDNGDSLVLPSPNPTAPSSCSDKVFMGWTESATVNNDGTGITYITTSTKPDGDKTYHAVFATKTTKESTTIIEKTKTETFENQSASTTYNSTQNYTEANSNAGIAWKIYYGTVSESDVITGSKSAQMRWYDSAPTNLPYIESQTKVSKLKSISYNVITSDTDYKYSVSYSTNGTSWTAIATNQSASTTKQTKTHTINANGVDAYIKIAITSSSSVSDKAKFRVDDVKFTYLESTTTTTTTYTDYVTSCIPTYTITWMNDDGTILKIDNVLENEEPKYTGDTPTKAANAQYTYTFNGWTPEIVAATTDATYTATYTATTNTYTITWKDWDGTLLETDNNVPFGTTPTYNGATPTLPEDNTYKYTFAGWDPEVKNVDGDQVYTAKYTQEKHQITVTWMVNGEEYTLGDPSTTVSAGEQVAKLPTEPTPDEENNIYCGQVFVGWTDNPIEGEPITDAPALLFKTSGTSPVIYKEGDKTTIIFYAVFADYEE